MGCISIRINVFMIDRKLLQMKEFKDSLAIENGDENPALTSNEINKRLFVNEIHGKMIFYYTRKVFEMKNFPAINFNYCRERE